MSRENKVRLKSSDDEIFEVDELVAYESQILKVLIEDMGTYMVIPLPNVSGRILSKVIEYCKYHVESQKSSDEELPVPVESQKSSDEGFSVPVDSQKSSDEELPVLEGIVKQRNAEFVKVDKSTLYELIQAANYLNIKHLVDLTSQALVDMINNKSPQEIREILHIKNVFTDEEAKRENKWACSSFRRRPTT